MGSLFLYGEIRKFEWEFGNLVILRGCATLTFFLFICSREFEHAEIRKFARFVSGLTNKIGSQEKFFFHGNLRILRVRHFFFLFYLFAAGIQAGNSKFAFVSGLTNKVLKERAFSDGNSEIKLRFLSLVFPMFKIAYA